MAAVACELQLDICHFDVDQALARAEPNVVSLIVYAKKSC